jgi:hypothetical protein
MSKTRDDVLPRSGTSVRLPPGAPTPRSGIYEQVGARGGRISEQVVSPRGEPPPPVPPNGKGWILVRPDQEKK